MVLKYCTATAVATLLGKAPGFFTTGTSPTLAQVNDLIERACSEIEGRTNRAWRERTAVLEYHEADNFYKWGTGKRVFLNHHGLKTALATASGDSLEVWNGSTWEQWVGVKTEGRANDFWLQPEDGYLYLFASATYRTEALRITYRYSEGADTAINDTDGILSNDTTITVDSTASFESKGYIVIEEEEIYYSGKTSTTFTGCTRGQFGTTAATHADNIEVFQLPWRIRSLAAKLVALELTAGDDYSVLFPEGTQNISLPEKRSGWKTEVEREIQNLMDWRLAV